MRALLITGLVGLPLALSMTAVAQDAGVAPPSAAPASKAAPAAPASKAAAPTSAAAPVSAGAPASVAQDDDTLSFEDAVDVPPPKVLPPMPADDADFLSEQSAFGAEVITDPEKFRAQQRAEAERRARSSLPMYQQSPYLAYGAEAAAGLFSAGLVGLLGGTAGNAINAGERNQPLDGPKGGRLYGLMAGGFIGSAVGVWGAANLFDKDTAPGWSFLGSGIGTLVGGGAAAGILVGIDDRNTAGGLAVGTLFLSQILGAMIFAEIGIDDDPPAPILDPSTP